MLPVVESSGHPMWHISSGAAIRSAPWTVWNLLDLMLSSRTFKRAVIFSVAVSHYLLGKCRLRHRFGRGIVLPAQLNTKLKTRWERLDCQISLLFTPLFLPVLRLHFLGSKGS